VVVPDAVLRAAGEPCAGGEPFLYVHATAPYRVEDARGGTVARGTLPEGRAVSILTKDPGVPRTPTTCRVRLRVPLSDGDRYRLVLPEGGPLPFTPRAGRATVVLG
jgi:hypothetical protein